MLLGIGGKWRLMLEWICLSGALAVFGLLPSMYGFRVGFAGGTPKRI